VARGLFELGSPAVPLSASGGTGPYGFAVTAGALFAGLLLNAGTFAGTLRQTGAVPCTVTAPDANGRAVERRYTQVIRACSVKADFEGDGKTVLRVFRPDAVPPPRRHCGVPAYGDLVGQAQREGRKPDSGAGAAG